MMDRDDVSKFNNRVAGRDPAEAASNGDNKVSPALIAFGIVLAAALIFFFRNSQQTELDFLFFKVHNKTRWLVIVCILIGGLLDRLFTLMWRRHKRSKAEERLAAKG